jgi:hypothetical protein
MTAKNRIRIEERLADLTDRLLAGEPPDSPAGLAERELAALQATVERTRRVLQAQSPDPAVRERIWSRLAAEWHRGNLQAGTKKTDWLSSRRRNQLLLLRVGIPVGVVLFLAGFLVRQFDSGLAGAAQNDSGILSLIGGMLLLVVLVVFWFVRKS